MSTIVTLPDGQLLEIPDDISEEKLEQLRTKLLELYPEAAQEAVSLSPVEQSKDAITPPEDPGFLKRIFSAFKTGVKDIPEATESAFDLGLVSTDESVRERAQELKEQPAPEIKQTTFQDVTERFQTDTPENFARGAGETLTDYAGETIAGTIPVTAIGVAGGLTAVKAFSPLLASPPTAAAYSVASPLLFGLGFLITTAPYMFGKNLERQVEVAQTEKSIEELTAEDVDVSTAAGAAVLQSTLDSALFLFTGGAGKPLKDTAIQTFLTGAAKGFAKGAPIEAGTEGVQTAIERYQAGLPIRPEDEQAVIEYLEAFAGGFVAGGPLGSLSQGAQAVNEYVKNKPLVKDTTFSDPTGEENNINIPPRFDPSIVVNDDKLYRNDEGEIVRPSDSFNSFGVINNSVKVTPANRVDTEGRINEAFQFGDIPANSKIRLFFYEKGKTKLNDQNERVPDYVTLKDPKTKKSFFKDYKAEDFFDETTNLATAAKLEDIEIEYNNKIYSPLWVDPKDRSIPMSFVEINQDTNNPLNLTKDAFNIADRASLYSLDNISKTFQGKVYSGLKNIPKGATEEDILNNIDAKRSLSFLLAKGRKQFKADRGLDSELYNTILGDKYQIRSVTKKMQDLAVKADNSLRGLSKQKIKVDSSLREKGYSNLTSYAYDLIDKYLTSPKNKPTVQQLKDIGIPKETIDYAKGLRRTIDNQSIEILNLMKQLDPNQQRYGPEIRDAIKKRIGSYVTTTYGLFVDPTYKAPNRPLATKAQKAQHATAKRLLSDTLQETSGLTPAEANAQAEQELNDLYKRIKTPGELTIPSNQTAAEAEAIQDDVADIFIDRGILKKVGALPKEIKAVMDEITNPIARGAYTAVKQAELISNLKTFNTLFNIANDPEARQISPVKSGAFSKKINVIQDETNPFNGYYATPEFAEAIEEVGGNYLTSGVNSYNGMIWGTYQFFILKPKNFIQRMKLIYSPSTQLRNLESAIGFVLVNGNLKAYSPKEYRDIWRTTTADFKNMTTEQGQESYRYGVLNTGVFAREVIAQAELAGRFDDPMGYVAAMEAEYHGSDKKNILQKGGKLFRDYASDPLTKSYQFGDNVWKQYAYEAEKKTFTDIFSIKQPSESEFNYQAQSIAGKEAEWERSTEYRKVTEDYIEVIKKLMFNEKFIQGLNAPTPKGKLEEAIKEIASYRVRNNMPNYDFVAPFTEKLRASPLGNFTAFPTEQVRTSANVIYSAKQEEALGKELKNQGLYPDVGKKLRKRGIVRATSFATYVGAVQTVPRAVSVLELGLGVGAVAAIATAFLPEWEQEDNILIVSYDKNTGDVTYVNLTNSDAYDVVAAPFRSTFKGFAEGVEEEDPQKALDGIIKGIKNFLEPYVSFSIAFQLGIDLVSNNNSSTGRPIYNDTDSFMEKGGKMLSYALRLGGPGALPQIQKFSESFKKSIGLTKEEESYTRRGRKIDEVAGIARISGLTYNTTNLLDNFAQFGLSEYKKTKSSLARDIRQPQYDFGKEFMDTSDLLETYRTANEKYYELVNETRKNVIQAGNEIYLTPEQFLERIIDRNRSISKEDTGNLFDLSGKFIPLNPSEAFFNTKDTFIETLKRDGASEEAIARVEAVEYPNEEFTKIFNEFAEKELYKYELKEDPNPDKSKMSIFNQDS